MSYASIPFERAIRNATATPARMLGIERERGTLAPGLRADLSIWDASYEILTTIVGGVPVFGAEHLARPPVQSL
jgi:N-acetylglucosamine-6-phosphate deacetylase